jgi:S-disulfanyl-L-cysteine oxidoreductase SoxD
MRRPIDGHSRAGGNRAAILAMACLLGWVPAYAGTTAFPGVGRTATPAEITAWDIDVRPDFKGLPAGSGSVTQGRKVWDDKCASCHGTFGESNEVFTPLVGGTTAADIRTGRVKTLVTGDVARTTLMKLSSISTLWDYIRRAMPWNAPKSLSTDEVYASVAYLLNLGDIVADDFVLTDANIREVQARLPNRNGMTRGHGMWDVRGRADVANAACMRNCATEVNLSSTFPESAKDDFGDIAQQNRSVGLARGRHGERPAQALAAAEPPAIEQVASRGGCLACHGVEKRLAGPAFKEVAAKYRGNPGIEAQLVEKVRHGGSGVWGSIAMPPNPDLAPSDARALVRWVLGL